MGANATTSVPVYASGEVLTAANLNITNSGIPVFATTVTRDAAFGGTGEKTLAEGQFAYIEATNTTQYYDGTAWQSVGVSPGLVLIKTQTIGSAVSSVTVSDAFSGTYDGYKITLSGGLASTETQLNMTLGASSTQYYTGGVTIAWATAALGSVAADAGASWLRAGYGNTTQLVMNMDVMHPFQAVGAYGASYISRASGGLGTTVYLHNVSSSFSAFTLTCSTGNITGGTIRVYGYANS